MGELQGYAGDGELVKGGINPWERVQELAEFMAYCFAERKNKEATVAWKLIAANGYHEQSVALSRRCSTLGSRRWERGSRGRM